MSGHNLCFNGKIRKVILVLSQLPLLIWSSGYYNQILHFIRSAAIYGLRFNKAARTRQKLAFCCSTNRTLNIHIAAYAGKYDSPVFYLSGPVCSKLTMSLVNVSLKF